MARVQFDPPPANSSDLAAVVNEHSKALDAVIGVGSTTPGIAYTDGTLTGFDVIDVMVSLPNPAGGTADTPIVMPFKGEILNMTAKKITANAGANANSVQLQTAGGAANISDAISLNGKNRGDLVSAANLDDTGNAAFAAGATLNLHQVKAGGDAACRVRLSCVVRP